MELMGDLKCKGSMSGVHLNCRAFETPVISDFVCLSSSLAVTGNPLLDTKPQVGTLL